MAAVVLLCLLFAYVAVAAILNSLHNPTAATGRPPAASTFRGLVLVGTGGGGHRCSRQGHRHDTVEARGHSGHSHAHKRGGGRPPLRHVAGGLRNDPHRNRRPGCGPVELSTCRSLVGQDLQFLDTLDGLPSLGLGSYLAEVGKRSTQLQTVFGQVEGELHTATT